MKKAKFTVGEYVRAAVGGIGWDDAFVLAARGHYSFGPDGKIGQSGRPEYRLSVLMDGVWIKCPGWVWETQLVKLKDGKPVKEDAQ